MAVEKFRVELVDLPGEKCGVMVSSPEGIAITSYPSEGEAIDGVNRCLDLTEDTPWARNIRMWGEQST